MYSSLGQFCIPSLSLRGLLVGADGHERKLCQEMIVSRREYDVHMSVATVKDEPVAPSRDSLGSGEDVVWERRNAPMPMPTMS